MTAKRILAVFALVGFSTLVWSLPASAQNTPGATPADPWPRQLKLSNATVVLYQPQINSWEGNQLDFRAAMAVTPTGSKQEIV